MDAKVETAEVLQIGKRGFVVERTTDKTGRTQFLLHGKRGALYATMRFLKNPEVMYLMNARTMVTDPIGPVTLREVDGELRWFGAADV